MTTTKTYNLEQILTQWIVNNNPSAVRQVLINNSLISASSNPGRSEMAKVLYDYYLINGKAALNALLKQIPANPNTSESQKAALANSAQEIASASGGFAPTYQSISRVADASANKWWNDVIDVVTGSETTTVAPTVTTTTSTSPLVIGGLIAGVLLILGLAYFFIGRRSAA